MERFRRINKSLSPQRKTLLLMLSGMILLSVSAMYVCLWQGWVGDMPQPLVATAVIFPLAFSINAAYTRRGEALACQASLVSNTVMLYLAHRDWKGPLQTQTAEARCGTPAHADRCGALIGRLLNSIAVTVSSRKAAETDGDDPRLEVAKTYQIISEASLSIELLRDGGLAPTEVSNANQCLRSIIQDVERLRRLRLYQTPRSLKKYCRIFLYGLPVLLGPYFAFLATKHSIGVAIFVAVLYSLILGALDYVHMQLENPFDNVGSDDVHLDMSGFYAKVLRPASPAAPAASELAA